MPLNLTKFYSINFSLPKRAKNSIKFIIIHYTGMKKESKAIRRLCDSKAKVSSHYFIKNSGDILSLVPELYEAWHAGKSNWKNFDSLNKNSIGIEISNPGHDHGYKKFSLNQISSLIELLKYLVKKYKIKRQDILGHSDIAPNRKKDPGEKFPWNQLAKKNLCKWHNLNENYIKKYRGLKPNAYEEKIFLDNLYKIGYSGINKIKSKKEKVAFIKTFQRRFRQKLISGIIDKECLLISKNLIKS